tara:strand:- start:1977 stop:2135 length:159 start_codon:yes stop_codon:yes gene_type:complete
VPGKKKESFFIPREHFSSESPEIVISEPLNFKAKPCSGLESEQGTRSPLKLQ